MKNYNDIDEQIQKLQRICDITYERYKFCNDEFEAETEEGFIIHQNLIDKLAITKNEFLDAVHNYNTLHRFCSKNKIVLIKHWIQLGFTPHQVQNFLQEL